MFSTAEQDSSPPAAPRNDSETSSHRDSLAPEATRLQGPNARRVSLREVLPGSLASLVRTPSGEFGGFAPFEPSVLRFHCRIDVSSIDPVKPDPPVPSAVSRRVAFGRFLALLAGHRPLPRWGVSTLLCSSGLPARQYDDRSRSPEAGGWFSWPSTP